MAKAHVLTTQGQVSRVAFHISIPAAGNNGAGIQWRTAVKNSGVAFPEGKAGTTILPDGDGTGGTISSTEKTDLVNGLIVEAVSNDVTIPSGLTTAQANAFLDDLHAAKAAEVQAIIQARLQYFGYTRT